MDNYTDTTIDSCPDTTSNNTTEFCNNEVRTADNPPVITVDAGPWVIDPNAEIIYGVRKLYESSEPIPEDIFGQTRLYSGPHPDRYTKYTQPTLSEPIYECRLGWYYSPERTTCKRTGQPLKKKPSYRYERTFKGDLFLGREQDDTTAFLDDVLKLFPEENYVVFIPQELWSQYPNASSYQKSPTEGGTVTVDLNSPVESSVKAPVTVSSCTPHNTKPTLWKRFLNWLSLEY